jgi:hypothetical protein
MTDVERSILFGQDAAPPTTTTLAPATTVPAAAVLADGSATAAPAPPTSVVASTVLPPGAAKTMTVLSDSVLLGAKSALTSELADAGWTVDYRGRPP